MKLPNPEPGNYQGLVCTQAGGTAHIGTDIYYEDRSPQSRTFGGLIGRGVGGAPVVLFSFADNLYPNDTDWHHVALTYNQVLASGNALIYVDSVSYPAGNKTGNTPSTSNSSYELHIGSLGNETGFLNGSIDDVRIYNYARTPEQILIDYNAGLSTYFK